MLAPLATPPYYAVIFTSVRTPGDLGYSEAAERMDQLAKLQPGYLGIDSARDAATDGATGITVSYWRDLESIRLWKSQLEHLATQQHGREQWYSTYTVRVLRVEYEYQFTSRLK